MLLRLERHFKAETAAREAAQRAAAAAQAAEADARGALADAGRVRGEEAGALQIDRETVAKVRARGRCMWAERAVAASAFVSMVHQHAGRRQPAAAFARGTWPCTDTARRARVANALAPSRRARRSARPWRICGATLTSTWCRPATRCARFGGGAGW